MNATPKPADDAPYFGPERRRGAGTLARLLAALLDEIDHGMMVVTRDAKVLHLNHAARQDLNHTHPLHVQAGRLTAVRHEDMQALLHALHQAVDSHKRTLMHLWHEGADHPVSVMPLPAPADPNGRPQQMVLLKLARQQLAGHLAVSAYCQANGLSSREQEVLLALCEGMRPGSIAEHLGISVATVRSHIQNLRKKAGAPDVTALIRQVAKLPPMMPVIKRL